jgi:hypothetical protein
MSLGVEGVVDGCVGGEKSLGRRNGFESLHPSLSSSDGQMGVLGPVVFAQSARLVKVIKL